MALERYILHVIQVASETELDDVFTDPVGVRVRDPTKFQNQGFG